MAVKLPKRLTMPEAFNNSVWCVGAATTAFLALFFDVFVRSLAVMSASDRWGDERPPSAPFQKRIDELDKIKAENQRLVNQYMQNNPSLLGAGIAQLNTAGSTPPSPPKPAYMDQTLLSQLTKLTPEQATLFDPFDQLSDLDQYNLSQAYPELQSQLRDSSYVSPYGLLSDQELFNRRYGLKDGGSVDLTIITMPDISGSGVESLFKTR